MRGGGALSAPSAEVLDPGQQLGEGERLGQIVVAAGTQPLHAVVDLAQRGEKQHRRRVAGLAQVLNQAQSVQVRQHAVDDQQVERPDRSHQQAFPPVLGDLGAVPALAQTLGQILRRIAIVLDDQNAHGVGPGSHHG